MKILHTLLAISVVSIFTTNNAYTTDFLQHVANNYLKSFDIIPSLIKPIEPEKPFLAKLFHLKGLPISSISDHEYRTLGLQAAPLMPIMTQELIDTTFIDKLEIVKGGEIATQNLTNIIGTHHGIDLTPTRIGKQGLITILTQPTNDVHLLQKRQLIIAELIRNPQLITYCLMIFNRMKEHESSLITYQKDNPGFDEIFKITYFNDAVFNNLNKNTSALEASTRFTQLCGVLGIVLPPLVASLAFSLRNSLPSSLKKELFANHKSFWIPYIITLGTLHTISSILIFNQLNLSRKLSNYLQQQLINVAGYLECARQLAAAFKQHPQLYGIMSETIIPIEALVTGSGNHSSQLKELINNLNTDTFKGETSFFSLTGRILATHKLLVETKDEFASVLQCLGNIEAFVAIASNFQLHAEKNNHYCFVEFIDRETPYIKTVDFWNPFIPSEQSVANSIEIGSVGNPQNIILTGPNTGGKSVLIKGILINILLAQTFGIASAKQFKMTPFYKLNCYLNITDNIAEGVSLFKAEVLRAKNLINSIKSLKNNQFCFTIMDEVFCGTAPQEGEQAAYIFSKQLAEFSNTINIIATHYPKMPNLEQETNGKFKNYQIEVLRDENGKIKRTFKLKEGKSHINIAMDILKEEGVIA